MIQQVRRSPSDNLNVNENNCQWWTTRLAGRGRTQLNALTGVKCKTRRTLDIRTHIAASVIPWLRLSERR